MIYPNNLNESDRRWYDLICECRASGKSDYQWLQENNISSPTFYYHIKQLRKKACDIPERARLVSPVIQEVVPLVVEDTSTTTVTQTMTTISHSTENIAIRMNIQNISIEITNQATQEIIKNTLSALQYLC